ncbi:hypothetical protein GFY24_00725 [Nocardia sp. SYP-A9097]|uniref:hypothetical protein n=1 Tax=Nocardia sp. SYP-A9097 TaxID=2663237 RepID=UPI00129BF5A5|nr:hypothetical protein [Nocardia sp. SYP-A9097]MRH86001.1 hypothetical protein [Nocardia sp. SYP-A9097]
MAFRVDSRDNSNNGDGDRWLSWDGQDWTADPVTTDTLHMPGLLFPLTPTGPLQRGYGPGESQLLAAALWAIPAAVATGQVPDYPPLPQLSAGAVF